MMNNPLFQLFILVEGIGGIFLFLVGIVGFSGNDDPGERRMFAVMILTCWAGAIYFVGAVLLLLWKTPSALASVFRAAFGREKQA